MPQKLGGCPKDAPKIPPDAPKKNTFQGGFPGVGNEDFKPMRMSENHFIKDRLLTPFAARKVEVASKKFL